MIVPKVQIVNNFLDLFLSICHYKIVKIIFGFILLLVFSSKSLFAVEVMKVEVSGQILDSNNNPVPQASLVFIDKEGNTKTASLSDTSGYYSANIEQGVYSISVQGPPGTKLSGASIENKEVTKNETIDFKLKTESLVPVISEEKADNFVFIVIAAVVVAGVLVFLGFLFLKNKRSPQAGSSD